MDTECTGTKWHRQAGMHRRVGMHGMHGEGKGQAAMGRLGNVCKAMGHMYNTRPTQAHTHNKATAAGMLCAAACPCLPKTCPLSHCSCFRSAWFGGVK